MTKFLIIVYLVEQKFFFTKILMKFEN